MNLYNGEEASTTTKKSRVASFSDELLLYVSELPKSMLSQGQAALIIKIKRELQKLTIPVSVSFLCTLRLLVLCIYFVPPQPRNKPNHISITKKILLYVSCMRNIIYATSASENNRISLRNIFSWLMRRKHSSSSDIIPFDCPNILTSSGAENV